MEAVSGQMASLCLVFSTSLFQILNVIDQIIIVFIFIVGFHGNRIYQMTEKIICYIVVYGCYGHFYDFFNQCTEKKTTVRGQMC